MKHIFIGFALTAIVSVGLGSSVPVHFSLIGFVLGTLSIACISWMIQES